MNRLHILNIQEMCSVVDLKFEWVLASDQNLAVFDCGDHPSRKLGQVLHHLIHLTSSMGYMVNYYPDVKKCFACLS
jgi:hypothetical protein